MGYLDAVEARIQEAIAAGQFSNLPGSGRPLSMRPEEQLAGDNWIGYRVLSNAGMLPEWLNLGRDIEAQARTLRRLDERHAELVELARSTGDWAGLMPSIRRARDEYEECARSLRKRQDRFNWDAPGHRSQRPAIWVEYHLERLDARISMELPR